MTSNESKNSEPPFSWKRVFLPLHIITVLVVVILDQASKYAVVSYIKMGSRVEVLPFMDFVHTKNRGAAFGMFHHSGALFRLVFFGAVTVVCLYMLIQWLGTLEESKKFQRFCFALILGGAFGNLYDRVCFGEVTDFVDTFYRDYHFYIFNIADSAISVGVTLLIASMIPWAKIRSKISPGRTKTA